jgi:hypothetical protein
MELNFVKNNNMYEAEFEVTADFNIHVERTSGGKFYVYQKTVQDAKYVLVENIKYIYNNDTTIDLDMTALVYPKYIKVVSEPEVTMGVVTYAE